MSAVDYCNKSKADVTLFSFFTEINVIPVIMSLTYKRGFHILTRLKSKFLYIRSQKSGHDCELLHNSVSNI